MSIPSDITGKSTSGTSTTTGDTSSSWSLLRFILSWLHDKVSFGPGLLRNAQKRYDVREQEDEEAKILYRITSRRRLRPRGQGNNTGRTVVL